MGAPRFRVTSDHALLIQISDSFVFGCLTEVVMSCSCAASCPFSARLHNFGNEKGPNCRLITNIAYKGSCIHLDYYTEYFVWGAIRQYVQISLSII
jgi:hypothetical protein